LIALQDEADSEDEVVVTEEVPVADLEAEEEDVVEVVSVEGAEGVTEEDVEGASVGVVRAVPVEDVGVGEEDPEEQLRCW
jgi:hypothetical protein